jgi:hypothetical protein
MQMLNAAQLTNIISFKQILNYLQCHICWYPAFLDQPWRRGKRTSTYGAAAKLVMRILTCLFIYLTRT